MKALVQASIHDGFKNFEAAFKLQVGIYELMLRLELGDQETLKRRLEKVRKEFESLLSSEGYERDLDMVNLLEKMADSPQPERDKALQKNIKDFLKLMVHSDIQDTNVINYTNWLSGKLNPSFNT